MAVSTDKYSEPTFLAYLFGTGAENMDTKSLIIQKFVGLLAVGLQIVGCATTEPAPPSAPVKTHYTLSTGSPIIHPGLLPRETPVDVEWHYSNGDRKKHQGFIGWDFDGDGRFEMVDVYDENAKRKTSVFDFDGDGSIEQKVLPVDSAELK